MKKGVIYKTLSDEFKLKNRKKIIISEIAAAAMYFFLTPLGLKRRFTKPIRDKNIRTIVFVHGFGGNISNFFPLESYLRLMGWNRFASFQYRSKGTIEGIAFELKQFLDDVVKGGRIDFICHSMGGLIVRFYIQELGGHRRVDRCITLGTPHTGTYLSYWTPIPLLRQTIPDNEFMKTLNARASLARGVRFVSIIGDEDIMILPKDSAILKNSKTVSIKGLGHLSLLLSRRVWKEVDRRLQAPLT